MIFTRLRVGCIVEGYGDLQALPVVIRRIAMSVAPDVSLTIVEPFRVDKGSLVNRSDLERSVETVARVVGKPGGIVIVMDSDDDCPAELGPRLLQRARAQRSDLHIALALAKPHFEAWFVAAAESLKGQLGLPLDIVAPTNPEERSGKHWLEVNKRDEKYSPAKHQASFARAFDIQSARERSSSFDKCYREIESLVTSLREEAADR